MDFGPSVDLKRPSAETEDSERKIKEQQKKQESEIEKQRIRNMRGRSGPASLLSAGDKTGNNTLG